MKKLFFATFLISGVLAFTGCSQPKEASGVSVTIEPVKFFVDRLTSEKVDVNVMVPMGASPQTYAPTSSQLAKVSQSRLYVRVGVLGFEKAWMEKIRGFNQDMPVLNLSRDIKLMGGHDHHHHGHSHGKDPHIWMSPRVVKKFLPALRDSLKVSFPDLSEDIDSNYTELNAEVKRLDNKFRELARKLDNKKFMIFHPALTYLARDYGFQQIAIEHEGKEPSPSKLRESIDRANQDNIGLIFIQAEFDQRSARMVKEATNAELVVINPLAYQWEESMEEIYSLLQEYLK